MELVSPLVEAEVLESASDDSAQAGATATADPIPSATANAPTLPTYFAATKATSPFAYRTARPSSLAQLLSALYQPTARWSSPTEAACEEFIRMAYKMLLVEVLTS